VRVAHPNPSPPPSRRRGKKGRGRGNSRWCRILFGFASLLLASLAFVRPAAAETTAQLIAGFGFADDEVGFILTDPETGEVLAAKSADRLFMPASVAKLATAYAGEEILGADFRFSTRLLARGADLYLQGGGDPVLSAEDLRALAAMLRRAAPGPIAHFFYDEDLLPALPEISDRQPVAAVYNAGLSALVVDFNRVEVDWSPGAAGGLAFQTRSVADNLTVPTDWIGFAPAAIELPPGAPFVYVGGGVADRWQWSRRLPASGYSFLPVKDSGRHAALMFREVAHLEGVGLPAPLPGRTSEDAVLLARVDSRPLADIVAGLLRYSNNLSAELVALAAARRLTGQALSLEGAGAALAAWLEARLPETDWRGFRLANGSGLSAASRVSPRQMADLLAAVDRDPVFAAALPSILDEGFAVGPGGDPPGQPPAEQIVGKSGTMDYASGLVGFLPARGGRRLAFAIFVFDPARRTALDATMDPRILEPTPEARDWIRRARALDEALLRSWLARF
jgi:D-alanyl-D-alanine carboxypeptidase/D-alanyl-D-alanine-endopeptidase (penicillin-binding protein 4)